MTFFQTFWEEMRLKRNRDLDIKKYGINVRSSLVKFRENQ